MPWYENFFHGLVQRAWKEAQTDEQTQIDVDFLYDMLHLQTGRRVLDVFCGYGRHALELARLGCAVTGVDISDASIAELRTAAHRESLPINAVAGDFMTVPLAGAFDAAYCFGNSFSFFPHDHMADFLRRIADNLPPGGWFAADTGMLAESVLPQFQERSWMQLGDITFLMENEYHLAESRIDSHLTYLQNGHTEHRTARHYLYTMADLHRLFLQVNLPIRDVFSSPDGTEFVLGDDRLLLVARKN